MTKTILISNHHRRSHFFEETVTALWDNGFKEVWIQDTGNEKLGKYQGPFTQYRRIGQRSYDQGIVAFKEWLPAAKVGKYRNIFLLDNDCFCRPEAVVKFVKAFEEGGYGWASHLVGAREYKDHWTFKNDIAEVFDQEIKPAEIYPGFVPSPHYENCFSLFTTEVWRNIEPKDFSHSRLMLKSIYDKGYKMGAHRAE